MEIGLKSSIPTYSGGLGVLAGDLVRSFADRGYPVVFVSLLPSHGYVRQVIEDGWQRDRAQVWRPEAEMTLTDARAKLSIAGKEVTVRGWEHVVGRNDHAVPGYLLDTSLNGDLGGNNFTRTLYGAGKEYRLVQETILGIGGLRLLRELGHGDIRVFHLNEGHAALLSLERMREEGGDLEKVIERNVFTIHTPVQAGHDIFEWRTVEQFLEPELLTHLRRIGETHDLGREELHMTRLALATSRYHNAVSEKHGEVTRQMFPGYDFDVITNGVHHLTWTSPPVQALYDERVPDWRKEPARLRGALLPLARVEEARMLAKRRLIEYLQNMHDIPLDPDIFTIGFARRASLYKRANLIFHNTDKLKEAVGERHIQILYAGKAHPSDEPAKELIKQINDYGASLKGSHINVIFVPNYNMDVGAFLTAGVDLWLNTPERLREACGTSGMKAAFNFVPNFSVLDGWWDEAWQEGDVNGWAIGPRSPKGINLPSNSQDDADALYWVLNNLILPRYYEKHNDFLKVGRATSKYDASYYNTHRVVDDYWKKAYLL